MAVKVQHSSEYTMYFCTFTCFNWFPLFEIVNGYDLVYKWFNYLKSKKHINVVAYVIMPNHVHCILYFSDNQFDLSKIIANAKRFMAYDIIQRLKNSHEIDLLIKLHQNLTELEISKGQNHKVFEPSFDAKAIYSEHFLHQKINYIHHNPVSGKWQLANEFTDYEHSSASYYELEEIKHFEPLHYGNL